MPRVTTAQENFTSGELSPLIDGRFGLQAYYNGAHRLQNWLAITQGVARCRPGFQYVASTKSNGAAILIPFRFSIQDRYMLEFGEQYMRVYRNKALVLSGPSTPYEITTPYGVADLKNLRVIQVGNTMYLVHPSHKPRQLTRTGHTAWTLASFTPTSDPFTSAGNYPSVVAIFEQRLIFGSTNNGPSKIWFSTSGDFQDFTIGTAADNAFVFELFQEELNTIEYIAATNNRLLVGTSGGEILITSGNNTGLTPTNFNASQQTYYGSAEVHPLKLDNIILSVQRDGKTLLSTEYDLLKEGFLAEDRTILAEHITESGISKLAFQRGKPNLVWALRNDGVLVGMTYEPRQQVFGMHRQIVAGENAKVISIATLPSSNGPDELWIIAERTINGSTTRYVEFLTEDPLFPRKMDFWKGGEGEEAQAVDEVAWRNAMLAAQRQATHLDSALRYDGVQVGVGTLSAVTGTGVTLSVTGDAPFTAGMVGREIWGEFYGRCTITAFNSSTQVVVSISSEAPFPSTSLPSGKWYITASSVAGLSHLEGETIAVVGDGGRQSDKVVAGGAITLDNPAAVVVVGLLYTCINASMIIEGGSANGPSQTKPKNIDRLNMRLQDTIGLEFGTDLYFLQKHDWRSADDLIGRTPPLYSGDLTDLKIEDDWLETQKRIFLVQREPHPCTVLLTMPHFASNDT